MDLSKTKVTRREALAALLAGAAAAAGCADETRRTALGPEPGKELVLCGADEVFVVSLRRGFGLSARKVWSWRAAECAEIPEPLKRCFQSTDDCKPVDGGRSILISSSSGAVALVERETGCARFCAAVTNAHSIEMLPGGRIAAAASVSDSAGGNRIIVFDIATGRELASDPLASAHGLVWDAERGVLWALGYDELRAYRVAEGGGGKDGLKVEFQMTLPDTDGHELSRVPGTPRLFVSTGHGCWSFDCDTRQLAPHDVLAATANVKSYAVHPATGRIVYMQGEGKNWWTEHVHFLKPAGTLHLPGQRLYKARWL